MKKFFAILLALSVFLGLFSTMTISSFALDTSATYFFGNHAKNPMEEAGSQGFTPVMTPVATDPEGSLDPDALLVPLKQTELEENATRWGLKGEAWNGAAQWKNYTGIRSDGRINADKCAAGVRFDVPATGVYSVKADFFNNSPANGHFHYIFHKSGDTKKTLYSFDTNTITASTDHTITKGTMVQSYELYLEEGDVLYFVVDSKGQGTSGVYKNLEVAIDLIFVPTVQEVYKFGYTAENLFATKGSQNFLPVFSGTYGDTDEFPVWNMIGSDKTPVSESDTWGNYTKWFNTKYEYAFVRSSGHIQPQVNSSAGVAFVAPKDGIYNVNNIEIAFNVQSGQTVDTLYYSVYCANRKTGEATRLFSFTNKSTDTNQFVSNVEMKKGDRLYFIFDHAAHSSNAAKPRMRLTIKNVADKPAAPIVESQSGTTVTLKAVSGCEYGYAEGDAAPEFSDSNIFENLQYETEYRFYQRVKETSAELASASSDALNYTLLGNQVTDGFEPTVLGSYKFGYNADNNFSKKGMHNFFPVYSKTYGDTDKFPVWSMLGSDRDTDSRTDNWGTYTRWFNSKYKYAFVESTGYIRPQVNSSAGVVWVAPKEGRYNINHEMIQFNIQSGQTADTIYYSIYYANAETKEATRIFSCTNNSTNVDKQIKNIDLKKGDRIYFIIDMANHTMSVAEPRVKLTITHGADKPATPDAPVIIDQTANSVTLKAVDGCEYGWAEGDAAPVFSDSNVITGLEAGKEYKFYIRVKESGDVPASDSSNAAYTVRSFGDLNGDMTVDTEDITLVRKHMLGTVTGSSYYVGLIDANADKNIDIYDLVNLWLASK